MSDKPRRRIAAHMTADVHVPFRYRIVHGRDPSRKSSEQTARTKSLNLVGLSFETPHIEVEDFHLSFTEASYGRNSLEIVLDLGKRLGEVDLLGQVEWYESRQTQAGQYFIVGVGFIDVQADVMAAMREFLKHAQGFV